MTGVRNNIYMIAEPNFNYKKLTEKGIRLLPESAVTARPELGMRKEYY